ncbi:ABC transporter ATP-binding protein [Flavobacterium oreochromis]|uniref:ATP-binding cassette domain-containing protein n=1 Tax=Flavobacterium oreochromis TaxID=2906078 RepID=UPI00385FA2BA
MIRIENISYKIGNKTILENISTTFEPGKINLIIGPNGAGKSTLIKLISGQIKPSEGRLFFSEYTNNLSMDQLAKRRAVLSQNIEVHFPINVQEIVMMGRYPHFDSIPTPKDREIVNKVVAFFEIENLVERNFMTLSGGEKQRVHFARVMAQIWEEEEDRILIMDEPLTFLDIHYQYDFMYKIKELSKQKKLLIIGVLHDLNLTAKFADQIYVINKGYLKYTGTKKEIFKPEIIEKIYAIKPMIFQKENEYFISF